MSINSDSSNLLSDKAPADKKTAVKEKLEAILKHPSHMACADWKTSNFK